MSFSRLNANILNMFKQKKILKRQHKCSVLCQQLLDALKTTGLRGYYSAQDRDYYQGIVTNLHLETKFASLIQRAEALSLNTILVEQAWKNLKVLYSSSCDFDSTKVPDLVQYLQDNVINKISQFIASEKLNDAKIDAAENCNVQNARTLSSSNVSMVEVDDFTSPLFLFNIDIFITMCENLDPWSLYYLSRTNNCLQRLAYTNSIWSRNISLHFPEVDVAKELVKQNVPKHFLTLFSKHSNARYQGFSYREKECFTLVRANDLFTIKKKKHSF